MFLTGPIVLKDRMDLHLERGAMILLTPDKQAHLRGGKVVPGISASKRKDVSITGEGIIDGNGAWWRGVKRGKVSDVEWTLPSCRLMVSGSLQYYGHSDFLHVI